MNKLFVPYELALYSKFGVYENQEQPIYKQIPNQKEAKEYFGGVTAPLYQQLVDWFLEKHDIFVETLIFDRGFLEKNKFCFQWRIYNKSEEWETNLTEYKSPIEALTKALEEAFKLI